MTFESGASNLVPADSNATEDVFVHDRSSGVTTRMSISSSGGQANSASTNAAISPNGRYVAFESAATNLVPADANGVWDTFVHDRVTGTTVRVSVSSSGEEANFEAAFFTDSMTVSNHGDVVWPSYATNLVPGPDGFVIHLFLHDLDAGTTELVSVSSSGALSEGDTEWPDITPDGRYVEFGGGHDNLDPPGNGVYPHVFVRDRATRQTREYL